MITADARVTVEEVLARVRVQIAQRRGQPLPAAQDIALEPDYGYLQVLLTHAQRVADLGTKVPPFGVLPAFARGVARLTTRILYFALRVISVDQGVYNGLVLQILHGLTAGLRQGEAQLNAQLGHLAAVLADGRTQYRRLEAALADIAQRQDDLARQSNALELRMAELGNAPAVSPPEHLVARDWPPHGHTDDSDVPARLAELYADFEDRFRGPPETIRQRTSDYLPVIQAAGAGTAERPVIDLGCGRGEWLEVLRESGLHARGVDNNPVFAGRCRALGLDTAVDDALIYLRALPDKSCGAVTAIHVVEHVPFPYLIALLDEILRALAPGGVTILETPNPYNLLVGACTFHTDPTHRQPLAPPVLRFLVEARGFGGVEVRELRRAPVGAGLDAGAPALLRSLEPHLTAAEDYAVIGQRC